MNPKINNKLQENQRFFNRWASTYDRPLFQFWMRRFYRPLIGKIKDTDSVLDVSCGSGEFLREVAQTTTAKLSGIDVSENMVKVAREKLSRTKRPTEGSPKVVIFSGDVHALPFPQNSFDYVISTESFHHYYNQKKALEEMNRVAKKGGKVVVVDINFFIPLIHWLFERLEPGCVKIHSRRSLRELFARAGLQQIRQRRSFIFALETEGVKL